MRETKWSKFEISKLWTHKIYVCGYLIGKKTSRLFYLHDSLLEIEDKDGYLHYIHYNKEQQKLIKKIKNKEEFFWVNQKAEENYERLEPREANTSSYWNDNEMANDCFVDAYGGWD